jgi:DNA polymerase-3 subunit epsilon
VAYFQDGLLVDTWKSFVDPDDKFGNIHIGVHGITPEMVMGAPKISEILDELSQRLSGSIVVHHTAFDRSAIENALAITKHTPIDCRYLDSSWVIRHTWDQYRKSGFGLSTLAKDFNIEFSHHDALEDARVTGEILVRAIDQSGIGIEEWVKKASPKPSRKYIPPQIETADGPLSGETVVFSGIAKIEIGKMMAKAGCIVKDNVTSVTTILVLSDVDFDIMGWMKSAKHIKAEKLIAKGQPIRIISETDFRLLIDGDDSQKGES